MDISVVIPVYGCREAIPELYRRLTETLSSMVDNYEIILIDDCCPQNSWEEIAQICNKDVNVVGIKLTRNFGQHRAIRAGLDRAKGEWTVIMDCDLQDRPEDIPLFYHKAREGFYIVLKRRQNRKESQISLLFSRAFYKVYNYLTGETYDGELSNFCIMKKDIVDILRGYGEYNCDYIMLAKWLGFRYAMIELEDNARYAGKSSYSFVKKIKMAIELITEHSTRPLMFVVKLGFIISAFAMTFLVYVVARRLIVNDFNVGWSSLIASIYLMGGILLSAVGVVGIYIGNIFDEAKGGPLYVIQEAINDHQ